MKTVVTNIRLGHYEFFGLLAFLAISALIGMWTIAGAICDVFGLVK